METGSAGAFEGVVQPAVRRGELDGTLVRFGWLLPVEEVHMWIVAGVLMGLVVLGSLIGFHTGPHAHVVAGAAGFLAAAWFAFMIAEGTSAPVLWALLSSDLVIAAGLGTAAWKGLSASSTAGRHLTSVESAEGVAVSDLEPEGIVRVCGEQWSAISVNGIVRAGSPVQVLRAAGVRLEVWGEVAESVPGKDVFTLDW